MPRAKLLTPASDQPPRPRGRPRLEDLAGIETRLLSVSSALFFRQGYGATTMADVARAARVSKTTLYTRFPGKADLFRAIVASRLKSWQRRVNSERIEGCESLEALLMIYGDMVVRASLVPETVAFNRLMFAESGRFPELAEAARIRSGLVIDSLSAHIRTFAVRDGKPCRDPVAAATLFQSLLVGRFSTSLLEDRVDKDSAAWLRGAVKSFLAGRSAW